MAGPWQISLYRFSSLLFLFKRDCELSSACKSPSLLTNLDTFLVSWFHFSIWLPLKCGWGLLPPHCVENFTQLVFGWLHFTYLSHWMSFQTPFPFPQPSLLAELLVFEISSCRPHLDFIWTVPLHKDFSWMQEMVILSLTWWEREVGMCARMCSENLGLKQNGV